MSRPPFGFSGAILLAALGLAACGRGNSPPAAADTSAKADPSLVVIPADSPKLAQIEVATVAEAEMPTDEFTAPGSVELNPNAVARVTLPVPGRVTEVLVRFGDAVKKSQTLLTLESPDADAAASAYLDAEGQLALAAAAVHKADVDYERVQDLFKGDAVARKELIAAETTATQARAALRQAEASVEHAKARLALLGLSPGAFRQRIAVKAPISGKITELTTVAGEYRNDLSAHVMTIADLSTVWVAADVPESSIRLVKIGERFDLTLAAFPGEVFEGLVARIADSVDPESRTVEVWAELPNPEGRLRPDMFGEVRHIESLHMVPAIPAGAVIQTQERTIVYRELDRGTFAQTPVTIGKRSGTRIPVLEGLKAGDRIVVNGAMLLRGY